MSCAFASIAGFALRGYWKLTDNALLQCRATKILPHLVDTLLLATAIAMLILWKVSAFELNWILAKILALLAYIGLGMLALRFAKRQQTRAIAYVLALATAMYIISVAHTKSVAGWLSYTWT